MATSPSEPADTGGPSPEELAAIVAAVAVAWPGPAPAAASPHPERRTPGWRFSGRWWAPDDVAPRRP